MSELGRERPFQSRGLEQGRGGGTDGEDTENTSSGKLPGRFSSVVFNFFVLEKIPGINVREHGFRPQNLYNLNVNQKP